MIIAFGADHGGYRIKDILKRYSVELGFDVEDVGTYSEESVDYPVFAQKVGEMVTGGKADFGVLICRTGIGMSIAANKIKGIRAALCYSEGVAKLSRLHNNANVLCLAADFFDIDDMKQILRIWVSTEFEGGRHQRRVQKIEKL